MKIKPIKIDEARVKELTYRNKEQAKFACERVNAYLSDAEKEKRLLRSECTYCFYFNGSYLVGQAFTEWECGVCSKSEIYPNTGVPKVCKECADIHSLCVRCGADIHTRTDRPKSIK